LQELLARIGLAAAADAPASSLSHGQKQWLELGMLLAQDPLLLLVDEPVAGMTERETERTAELLTALAGAFLPGRFLGSEPQPIAFTLDLPPVRTAPRSSGARPDHQGRRSPPAPSSIRRA